jgi:hypothetical protein
MLRFSLQSLILLLIKSSLLSTKFKPLFWQFGILHIRRRFHRSFVKHEACFSFLPIYLLFMLSCILKPNPQKIVFAIDHCFLRGFTPCWVPTKCCKIPANPYQFSGNRSRRAFYCNQTVVAFRCFWCTRRYGF